MGTLGANAAHGLRRTNADKRRAVEIALKEFPKLSSREIAKVCAVGDQLVNQLRDSRSSETRLGADGKVRRVPVREAPEPKITKDDLEQAGEDETPEAAMKPERFTMPPCGMFVARGAIAELEKIQPKDREPPGHRSGARRANRLESIIDSRPGCQRVHLSGGPPNRGRELPQTKFARQGSRFRRCVIRCVRIRVPGIARGSVCRTA